MNDRAKDMRRTGQAEIEAVPGSREALEATHVQVWDSRELARHFIVVGVLAPSSSLGARRTAWRVH